MVHGDLAIGSVDPGGERALARSGGIPSRFGVEVAARICGVTVRQIRYWISVEGCPAERGAPGKHRKLSYRHLLHAFVLATLRERGYSFQYLHEFAAKALPKALARPTWSVLEPFTILVEPRTLDVVIIRGTILGKITAYERIETAELRARVRGVV